MRDYSEQSQGHRKVNTDHRHWGGSVFLSFFASALRNESVSSL